MVPPPKSFERRPHGGKGGATTSPSTDLWIPNLPKNAKDGELRELFASYGAVHDVEANEGKAFVYYERVEDASAAKEALQGVPFDGHPLTIYFSRPGHCPGCGSSETTYKSMSATGNPRWRCKACPRTGTAGSSRGSVRRRASLGRSRRFVGTSGTEMTQAIAELEAENASLRKKLVFDVAAANARVEEVSEDLDSSLELIFRGKIEMATMVENLSEVTRRNDLLRNQNEKLASEVKSLRSDLNAVKEENEFLKGEVKKYKESTGRSCSELDTLKELEEARSDEKLKEVLEDLSSTRITETPVSKIPQDKVETSNWKTMKTKGSVMGGYATKHTEKFGQSRTFYQPRWK